MPFGSLVQLKVFHWQSGTPQLGSLPFLLWCLQQFILVTETFDGQLRLVYSLWNLLLLFWKFDFRWEFTMVSTQFLRKRVYHLQCPYSWQYMDVTRRAMAHFQVGWGAVHPTRLDGVLASGHGFVVAQYHW